MAPHMSHQRHNLSFESQSVSRGAKQITDMQKDYYYIFFLNLKPALEETSLLRKAVEETDKADPWWILCLKHQSKLNSELWGDCVSVCVSQEQTLPRHSVFEEKLQQQYHHHHHNDSSR